MVDIKAYTNGSVPFNNRSLPVELYANCTDSTILVNNTLEVLLWLIPSKLRTITLIVGSIHWLHWFHSIF